MYLKLGKRNISLGVMIAAIGGLGAVAVGITLAVMLPGRYVDRESNAPLADESAPASWVGVEDLLLENELERGTTPRWVPHREMKERWSEAEASAYWIDPRAIGVEVLEEEVTTSIRSMLEEVP